MVGGEWIDRRSRPYLPPTTCDIARGRAMKITRVETIPVDRYLFVQVHTDEGIVGLGESGTWGYLEASEKVVEKFGTYLVGQDPLRIEHHWQVMYRSSHFRGAAIMG